MLNFLQELLDKEGTPFTLKVYVAAITANHFLVAGQSVTTVFEGSYSRGLNPPYPHTVVMWDFSIVLKALQGRPFEPLQSADF